MSLEDLNELVFEPDEAIASDSSAFMVYRQHRGCLLHQGLAIKNLSTKRKGNFWFISNKNLNMFHRDLGFSFRHMLGQEEFPYKEGVLRAFDKLLEKRYPQRKTINLWKQRAS